MMNFGDTTWIPVILLPRVIWRNILAIMLQQLAYVVLLLCYQHNTMQSNMLVKKQSSTLAICLLLCFAVLTIWSSNKQINGVYEYEYDEDDEEEVPQDIINRRLTLSSIEQLKQYEESYYKEFEMPNWLRKLCNSSDYNDGMSSEEVSIAMSTAIAAAGDDVGEEEENLSKRTLASNLPTYTFQDALESTNTFSNSVGVLLYRPENDNFVLLYGNRQLYRPKLGMGFKELTKVLRLKFPEKFQGEKSDELGKQYEVFPVYFCVTYDVRILSLILIVLLSSLFIQYI
jgi:hypothetical protein